MKDIAFDLALLWGFIRECDPLMWGVFALMIIYLIAEGFWEWRQKSQ